MNEKHYKEFIENFNNVIDDKKIEFYENEKKLDLEVLNDSEKDFYIEVLDKNKRMACGLLRNPPYINNAMFLETFSRHELFSYKSLLLNQINEIDLIIRISDKLSKRNDILANQDNNHDDDDDSIGWMNDED
jgi:hypothetical protein